MSPAGEPEPARLTSDEPDPRLARGAEEVTFAFGDLERALFGQVRVRVRPGRAARRGAPAEPAQATVLAVVIADGRVLLARAQERPIDSSESWAAVTAGTALRLDALAPGIRWTLALAGEGDTAPGHGEGALELEFDAVGPDAVLAGAAAGDGWSEQPCAVRGCVVVGGRRVAVQCLGQRGRAWQREGQRPGGQAREVDAWIAPDLAVALRAQRPAGARGHDADERSAVVFTGDPTLAVSIEEARLSTLYDGDGRPRRVGLELWPDEESSSPQRFAGETVAAAQLLHDGERVHVAFLRFAMDGREGAGRYELRTPAR